MNLYTNVLLLNEIYNLKQIKRQGWLRPGRELSLNDVESVPDHSWCAAMLALLLLPNTLVEYKEKYYNSEDIESYEKDQIIKMLVVHDLAEAHTGDIPKGEKNKQDEIDEKSRFLYYKELNFPNKINIEGIYNLWEEFTLCKTLNSKIAKDIDQLECYIQLSFYREKLIEVNGITGWQNVYTSWLNSLNINTLFGNELKSTVDSMFFSNEEN